LQLALSLDADHERQRAILAALDRINARHGPGMIYLAASHAVRDAAPMRIAFTHIPNPSLEDDTPRTHPMR
jgi:DNA polymerase-4